jgi:NTE family protein
MRHRGLFIISFALSLVCLQLMAQDQTGTRPKIGYVFSGGGAKGMAHVGVVKVLEEVGLQPDYITGTSMGSIMGGLYSIGYQADELSHIVETVDWGSVLSNEIPANQVIMGRKDDYSRFMIEMPVYKGKPELPSGLIEGQKLAELFSDFTWRQAGVNDFNDFPIPFSCIGTDILHGELVEMNSGDLSSAMRASMAIPSVFTPVIRDTSHLLVDGGVLRNFPVQEVVDMGADIVIGAYVGFDSKMTAEQLRSLTSVITRTSLLTGAQDVQAQLPLVDYLILPDMTGFNSASFGSGVEIMKRGEAAARAQIESLRALADSVNALGPPSAKKVLPDYDSILVKEISVLETAPAMTRYIKASLGVEAGEWITREQLNTGIERLFGTLLFDRIGYYFEKLEEGYRLVFRIKEKANSTIQMALHYDNEFGPGAILNYTHLNSLMEGSRLSITGDISDSPQLKAYYDFQLGKQRKTIVSVFANAARDRLPMVYDSDEKIGDYRRTYFSEGVALQKILGINSELKTRFYYYYSSLKLSRSIREFYPDMQYIDNIVVRGPQVSLGFRHNSFNHLLYPTRGRRVKLNYRQALGTDYYANYNYPDSLGLENPDKLEMDPYWVVTAEWEQYIPLGRKLSLNFEFDVGVSHNEKPFPDNFYVGGYRYNLRENQLEFVGLQSHELLVSNYVKERAAIQWEPFPGLLFTALGNIILVADDNTDFLDHILNWDPDTRYVGAGAGLTLKTPAGPVSVFLGSRTDVWRPQWYTSIGFSF